MTASYLPTPPAESSLPASQAVVYLPTPLHPQAEAHATRKFKRLLREGHDGLTRDKCLELCDGILMRVGHFRGCDFTNAPRIRIISRAGIGCDSIDLLRCKEEGIVVTNVPGGSAQSVAEITLGLMLGVSRRIKELDARITSGELVPAIEGLSPGLSGRTVGLVGMGDIAYAVARVLVVFRCQLVVFSPSSSSTRWTVPEERYPLVIPHRRASSLDEMLPEIDFLSLHCPLTPQTRGMIGERELGRMKPGAVVINTARGGMIDEMALTRALKEGRLGGAGLDVFEVEPAYGETLGELGKMKNVICLPHVGAANEQCAVDIATRAVDIMADYFDGKAIRNRVA